LTTRCDVILQNWEKKSGAHSGGAIVLSHFCARKISKEKAKELLLGKERECPLGFRGTWRKEDSIEVHSTCFSQVRGRMGGAARERQEGGKPKQGKKDSSSSDDALHEKKQ